MTNAATPVYVALVGSDRYGHRTFVWGIGVGDRYGTACRDARHDAERHDYPGDVEGLLSVVVDAVTARAIEGGEIDAVALGLV